MARDPEVQRLRKEIEALLAFNKESLTSRTKWGEISFEAAQRDYERIFSVLTYLKVLPLEYLTDTVVGSITNEITSVRSLFDQVDKFNIQVPDPSGTRNNLVTQIHNRADGLYNVASPWVPFLAYQKGDVAENINKLTKAVNDAKAILDGAGADITAKKKDIDGIIAKAREASGKAGAAVFTEDFQKESEANSNRAKRWLHATWIIALVTIAAAALMWAFTEQGLDFSQVWQKLTTKLAILAVLISATAWCGKIYKALIHQATVNRHRALSLQTFQAFSSAASDTQSKDAVLLQTTRAIFSDLGTGFVDSSQSSSESDIKILEIVKSFVPK